MKDPAPLTGELRVPRTGSRALRLEAIEKNLRLIRGELRDLRGIEWYAQEFRSNLLVRRAELEEERRKLLEDGTA